MTQPTGRTSEIEMIARRVVQSQANVCAVEIEHLKKGVAALSESVSELTKTFNELDKNAVKKDDIQQLTTSVEEVAKAIVDLKGRWRLFTVVSAVVGFIGTVAALIAIFT